MNIVIINPDQMRADSMFHLGNGASCTPHLDRLSQEGASFSQAFCQNPVCTPSRCSFMSGWYPHVAGHRTMTHMMREHEPVLLRRLKEAGYHVWMNPRNDLLPAQRLGYYEKYCSTYYVPQERPDPLPDEDWRGDPEGDNFYSFFRGVLPDGKRIDDLWTEGAVQFIREYSEDAPFCVFLPLMLPHPVYETGRSFYERVRKEKLPARIRPLPGMKGKSTMLRELEKLQRLGGWEEERFDELRAVYLGMCSHVDDLVGQVEEALKEKGVYEDTAIFFFSDHGDYTGDYNLVEKVQNSFEDCLVNVPFLVKLPGAMQKVHGVQKGLVELVDFYGTVEELAGLGRRHTHFGHSLVPFLSGGSEKLRDAVFCEGGFRKGEEHCKETGGQAAPNPAGLYYPRQSLQASDAMYNGKAIMCRTERFKYVKRLYEADEFYDLEKDPQELRNEMENPAYAPEILALKERLLQHYLDTCDVVPMDKDSRMDPEMMRMLNH